jgi:hypothetical protein
LAPFVLTLVLFPQAAAREAVVISLSSSAGAAPRNAARVFENALRARGTSCQEALRTGDRKPGEWLVSLRLDASRFGRRPESFSITTDRAAISVTGSDDVGLMYGIFELLGQIESQPAGTSILASAREVTCHPQRKVRSVSLYPHNRDLEKEWMYSKEFWNRYFEMLARSRFNYFLLTFGHQTAYFAPPFPFLIEVPGFEQIGVPSLSRQERADNLQMLRTASALAEQWGVKFILGIWQQHAFAIGSKLPNSSNLVEGLTYQNLFDYSPQALVELLRLCPEIKGLQFRMNYESGIQEPDQTRFYTKLLAGLRTLGRPLYIDLRAKGLKQETIDAARSLGFPVTVSTKYWREHFGLPFHATLINPVDLRNYRRYGYWDLLRQGRNYDVLYEFWTAGSLKILLWGALDYARQFADSTRFGNATGFEVFAPLSQKGFLNWPGGPWHILADRRREYYQWEFERYWAFYMAFGLAGYGGRQQEPIFEAEFRKRFGDAAAPYMREAYRRASWVIPYITASHQPASSEYRYWPEMELGGLTDTYIGVPSGDDGRFYPIFQYVDDYLNGKLSARVTPMEVARRLEHMADATTTSLERAASLIRDPQANKEFFATSVDLKVHAALARYHAARRLSGTDYQLFRKTGERFHLLASVRHAQAALAQWKRIVELTGGYYYRNMVFNEPPEQIGHWADLLPFLERDVNRLIAIDGLFVEHSRKPAQAALLEVKTPWFFMPFRWKEEGGVLSRWVGPDEKTTPVRYPATEGESWPRTKMQDPRAAIQEVLTSVKDGAIAHAPVRFAQAGKGTPIHASLLGGDPALSLRLHYRIGERGPRFVAATMHQSESNLYTASLPPATLGQRIEYYLEGDKLHHGSPQQPHRLLVCAPSPARPVVLHQDVRRSSAGKDLRLRARVQSSARLAVVRLHYRQANQALDWNTAEMKDLGAHDFEAVIPGSYIVPGWDIMYAIEVVDECGQGIFYPDFNTTLPFVTVEIEGTGVHAN